MFQEGRNPTAGMMDEMFKLARTELHQFQPVALLAKAIHHSKRGQGTRRSTTVSRRLSAELKG